jgi:SAM-dependent methyltransferase
MSSRRKEGVAVYFAKGLAAVVRRELETEIPEAVVFAQDERFILADLPTPITSAMVSGLRSVDDLRLLVAGPTAIADSESLEALCRSAARSTYAVAGERAADGRPWSVTLSAQAPPWRDGTGWDPAPILARTWPGEGLDSQVRCEVDLRLQVAGTVAHVSLNATDFRLPRRPRLGNRLGALRPSIAAAMVRVLEAHSPTARPLTIYDPCCGTGTILAEAIAMGHPVYGSDIDEQAVQMTRERLQPIHPEEDWLHHIFVHDILRGPPTRVRPQAVVSNIPWGKQISVTQHQALYDALAGLAAAVVGRGGLCVYLTPDDARLLPRIRRKLPGTPIAATRLGFLGQTPSLIVVGGKEVVETSSRP